MIPDGFGIVQGRFVMTRKRVTDDQYGQLQRRMDEVARRVDEGTLPFDLTMRALQSFIEGKFRFADGDQKKPSRFQPWRTIKLGTGLQTVDDFRKAIKKIGNRIGEYANDILGNPEFITTSTKEIKVDLVNVSVAELGFPNGATRKKIYAKAKELGLKLCPAEVGPQLRLQYRDQPMNEWLYIGMEPITDSVGYLRAWYIECSGDGLWLKADYADPGSFWSAVDRWVFVRRPSTRA